MRTQEKEDKEWDDFFKKSLEKPDLSFDPRAWQAMEKKLNKRLAWQHAYRGGFFGLLVLILISTGVWYGLTETSGGHREDIREETIDSWQTSKTDPELHRKEANKKIDSQAVATKSATGAASAITEETKIDSLSGEEGPNPHASLPTFEKKIPILAGSQLLAEKLDQTGSRKDAANKESKRLAKARKFPLTDRLKSSVVKDTFRSKNANPIFREQLSIITERDKTGAGEIDQAEADKSSDHNNKKRERKKLLASVRGEAITDGIYSLSGQMIQEKENESEVPESLGIRPFQFISTRNETDMTEWPTRNTEVKVTDLSFPDSSVAKRRSTLSNRWSLNVILAPDLSTVRLNNFTTPGMSQGLSLEYQISPRISVQTGALYASKVYFAGPDDYQPARPWKYRKPERIDGECRVLDLPLNLRYKILIKERYAMYVITGLSSYLMRRERYEYIYPGYPAIYWSAPTKNQHWFSVINLSLGYERKLSQRFSLQVEPYVKLPLAGVGAGKVKLATTGAFFILKYHLGKRPIGK